MRGQFIRGDNLILPNNISLAGAEMILAAAFRNDVPTFFMALVTGVPDADMTMATMAEPTVANGYERKAITRDGAGWPTVGVIGNERFISTDWIEWIPTGDFDVAIQRVALLSDDAIDPTLDVYALSVPLPDPIILGASSTLDQRRFKYQIFL